MVLVARLVALWLLIGHNAMYFVGRILVLIRGEVWRKGG
jgi:hypothetical protein